MLYFLLKDSVSFPLLGHILNFIYYSLIVFGVVLSFFLAYKRILAFYGNNRKVGLFMVLVVAMAFPAGYVGSRAVNMFYYEPGMWSFQFLLEQFHEGGHHTFHGSLILPLVIIIVLTLIMRFDFFRTIDSFFLYIPLGHAFGRMGCLMVGCCWGQMINARFFGIDFTFKNPVPLYSICLNLILFFSLRKCYNAIYSSDSNGKYSGSVAACYLIVYGAVRFALEWIRTENKVVSGLTQAQIVMIIFITMGIFIWASVLLKYYIKGRSYGPQAKITG